jgi:dCMP deaminase
VGAIITDRTNSNILDIGYNGNYAGGPNTCDIDGAGICGCVHAEINALVKNSSEPRGAIYVTDSPCMNCAKAIINSGIEKVYYRNDYRIADGLNLLKKVLKVEKIK